MPLVAYRDIAAGRGEDRRICAVSAERAEARSALPPAFESDTQAVGPVFGLVKDEFGPRRAGSGDDGRR